MLIREEEGIIGDAVRGKIYTMYKGDIEQKNYEIIKIHPKHWKKFSRIVNEGMERKMEVVDGVSFVSYLAGGVYVLASLYFKTDPVMGAFGFFALLTAIDTVKRYVLEQIDIETSRRLLEMAKKVGAYREITQGKSHQAYQQQSP